MKLDTAADILEWAEKQSSVDVDPEYLSFDSLVFTPDTETAERLARAVRALRVVERAGARTGEGGALKPYDLTQTEEVLRFMRGGQYQKGHREVAAQLAQAMRITRDLRAWANAPIGEQDDPNAVGGTMPMHVAPDAFTGFECAQREVQWFLDDAVRWKEGKVV